MKKTIITMLIALVAICASADTYSYLKFTKTNGSTVTCSVEGIKVTYDNNNITVTNNEGTTTIALSEVQDMYFSNEAGGATVVRGDVDGDGDVAIADITALLNYLLTGNTDGVVAANADCDQDGEVAIADITALLNYLLTGNW